MQETYFGEQTGDFPLPPGWIRIWSKTRTICYYLRLSGGIQIFEWPRNFVLLEKPPALGRFFARF